MGNNYILLRIPVQKWADSDFKSLSTNDNFLQVSFWHLKYAMERLMVNANGTLVNFCSV